MSEEAAPEAAVPDRPVTAGGLLRQARQAQGLHIAALAAAIKVVPRKLELLETDQLDQLPDATFTRALAQTVCRTLKIDAAPILALLPPPSGHRLEQVGEGLNTPFRERPGRLEPKDAGRVTSPIVWLALVIVLLAAAVYALPANWLASSSAALARLRSAQPVAVNKPVSTLPAAAPSASSATSGSTPISAAVAPASASGVSSVIAADDPPVSPEPDAVTEAAASGVLQFTTTAESWIEVTDARGQSLIARVLQAGENVGLDGVMPMKVRIGNVRGTQALFRGQPLELAPHTRDNVARLELK